MIVETYEVTEETTEGRGAEEMEIEAVALIAELGLEGQQSLVRKREEGDEVGVRIPYAQMTATEQRVYSTLYPERSEVSKYEAGPIPLRVLQAIALAQKQGWFDALEVWGPMTHDPDPILVGTVKDGHTRVQYLLARWGDALAPFDELYDRAAAHITREWTNKARQVAAEAKNFFTSPEALVAKYLSGGWVHEPWT